MNVMGQSEDLKKMPVTLTNGTFYNMAQEKIKNSFMKRKQGIIVHKLTGMSMEKKVQNIF